MNITTEMASRSLNHVGEILCGDQVQIVHREDSDILILADGMGSGVRANMLSTLTSQIIGVRAIGPEPRITARAKGRARKMLPRLRSRSSICWTSLVPMVLLPSSF